MNYKLNVYPVETTEGVEWIAEYQELKFCSGSGRTAEEAVKEAEINKENYLEELKEENLPIPEPLFIGEFSGKFTVRISKSLHKKLCQAAQTDGVSINQFVGEAIATKIEQPAKRFLTETMNILKLLTDTVGATGNLVKKTIISAERLNQKLWESESFPKYDMDETIKQLTRKTARSES